MKPAVLLCTTRGCDVIAEGLLLRADLDLITLYDATSQVLEHRGIDHRPLETFIDATLEDAAFQRCKRRAELIAHELYGPEMRREWPGCDDATWEALMAEVARVLERDFLSEMRIVDMVRRCACETDLRLVISQEDISRAARTILYTAHQLGIPGLHVLHGFPYGTTNAHDEISADVVAASSEQAKKIYESFGADPDKVVVTGNPAWDIYARPPLPNAREKACQALGLDPDRPVVEYALTSIHCFNAVSVTHPLYHIRLAEAVLDAFATLAGLYPDWQFLLRAHPGDKGPLERLLAHGEQAGLQSAQIDEQPAHQSLCAIDALVCTHLNLGVEAILCGKPVVNVAIDALVGPLFQDDDAVLFAGTEAEIAPQIEAAMVDPGTRERLLEARTESIRRFNFANDGKATERVCTLALEMIEAGHRYVSSVNRFPEFETAFARALPDKVRTVLVVGRAARHVVDAIEALLHSVEVHAASGWDHAQDEKVEAVVLADPLPLRETAAQLLRTARSRLKDGGVVVAGFRHGGNAEAAEAFSSGHWTPPRKEAETATNVGQYARTGVDLILSRGELEPVKVFEILDLRDTDEPADSEASRGNDQPKADRKVDGWVMCARPRPSRVSAFGQARRERRQRADAANERGEQRYSAGDLGGAIEAFSEAITTWNEEGLYYNNLAVALYDANRPEEAWTRLLEALNCDPNLQSARDNLRRVAPTLKRTEEAEDILALFGSDEKG